MIAGRIARRMLDAPRTRPEEAALKPRLDRLGGEVVRLVSRDGLRLAGRWLEPEGTEPSWSRDPREAILLLHGYSGSVAPDLVEYGPTLRQTAGVLGLDFRGHGASDAGATTFGLHEIEDVGGALAWLGERGIRRVVLAGTSMGGITAIAATVVLGDGELASADADPHAPILTSPAPRPRIVGIVAEAVTAELPTVVANRLRGPGFLRHVLARRAFAIASRRLGEDLRAIEPARLVGLLEDLPLLLIHGDADTTVPPREARRLVAAAAPRTESWMIPGAGHGLGRSLDPAAWDERVTAFVRRAFEASRDREAGLGILASAATGASERSGGQSHRAEADHPA
ncbi:MAG: alpha/beta fold hydrolase [Candidatus Limnocylindrales bacterium]